MLSLTPALGMLCLLFGTASTLADPVSHLTKRSFNPREKWQQDEVNCITILNPAPGATYHPGFMVKMNYGTGDCFGANAAAPWSIHLYNNPEIDQNGKIRFDSHEVIADGLSEEKTQYTWYIPSNQKNVKNFKDYYVRIETTSHDGIKLVGNKGPFSITPNQLSRRAIVDAKSALKPHKKPLEFPKLIPSTANMSTTTDKPRPLEFLIGTWAGKGKGFYPTIPTFEFFEEVTFVRDPAGRPVIAYNQKTKRAVENPSEGATQGQLVPGSPLHAESGFIRLPGWSEVECELILSQPTGVASVEVGKIEGTSIDWTATGIIRSPKAKPPHVTHFTRKWVVDPVKKTLTYTFSMATENNTCQPHLEVLLHKVEA
ncbi:THAP domain-containing protein 4 [Haplosporangium sp. Z 27]|nr:THAP domain-containing protein 4 [Haplosporangium sp. Z 27]